MVVEVQELGSYAAFIRELAEDPLHYDPHFRRDADNLYGVLRRKDEYLYAVLDGAAIRGLFAWLILPEEQYVEMLIGFTRDETAFCEMLAFLEERYAGWEAAFVIAPRNEALHRPLEAKGGTFYPEQQKMRRSGAAPVVETTQIEVFTEHWRSQYLAMHRTDTYWTAERVLDARGLFRVLLAGRDGELLGYLDVTASHAENEVYDLFVKPGEDHRAVALPLLGKAIKLNGAGPMQVMVDVDAAAEIEIYRAAGFKLVEGQNDQTVTCRI